MYGIFIAEFKFKMVQSNHQTPDTHFKPKFMDKSN